MSVLLATGAAMAQVSLPNPQPISTAQEAATDNGAIAVPGDPQSHWPVRVATTIGTVTIYQPQLIKLEGDVLSTRAAVSILRTGQTDPVFGAVWMESRIATDRVARTAQILDINVTRTRFPDDNGLDERQMTAVLQSTFPQQPLVLSLDQLLAMVQAADNERQTVRDISNEPPAIVFRNHPSVLVQFDGAPRLLQVENTNLMRVDNTPFFVALDLASKLYYLKGGGRWYAASNPMGPYQDARSVPTAVLQLAETSGYKDPQERLPDEQAAGLEIVTAMEPTELIWTTGPEEMSVIPNTNLLYVSNTQSDVFLDINTQQIYVLLSGRWYTAKNRGGPWAYIAPDQLPADFRQIPADSEKGDVLAHVAGTQAARDAVADTFVPQTAAIDRKNFEPPTVVYDGAPVFQPIETTVVSYCVNSPQSVLMVRGRYYLCYNAVWYESFAPTGGWGICTSVPMEIYSIPSTCPVYSVRYVYVYDCTPDVVYVGYLPGYVGCYPHHGVVVYGTGYRYRPWIGRSYYARPSTFGFAARYNSYSGGWGFTIGYSAFSGPAWIGDCASTQISVSTWFGHGGYRPGIVHHDPAPRGGYRRDPHDNITVNVFAAGARRPELNVYERRQDVRRPPGPRLPPMADRAPARGDTGPRRDDGRNNVYADSKGNIYRKTLDGWERLEHNKWVPRDPDGKRSPQAVRQAAPEPSDRRDDSVSDLNRDMRARMEGEQRSRTAPKGSAQQVVPVPQQDRPRVTPSATPTNREPRDRGNPPPAATPAPAPTPTPAPSNPQRGGERDSRGGDRPQGRGAPTNDAPPAATPVPTPTPAPSNPQRGGERDSRGGDRPQGRGAPTNDAPPAATPAPAPAAPTPTPAPSNPQRGGERAQGRGGPSREAPPAPPQQSPQDASPSSPQRGDQRGGDRSQNRGNPSNGPQGQTPGDPVRGQPRPRQDNRPQPPTDSPSQGATDRSGAGPSSRGGIGDDDRRGRDADGGDRDSGSRRRG